MARFNIDGAWYDAATYADARKLAAQAKDGGGGVATKVRPGAQQVQARPPQVHVPPPQVKPVPRALPKPPPIFAASVPGALSFDMLCYRGEKNNWWSPPEERLICGMTLYQPWNLQVGIKSMTDLWEHLRKFIQDNCFGKIDAFAQYLRAQGRPFALATARTTAGSYTSDYNYVMKVANARTFLWGPKLTLGQPVSFKETADVTAD